MWSIVNIMSIDNLIHRLVNQIGKPYYQSNNAVLYHADCLDLMKSISDIKFDLTVTSPPYNIGKEYEKILGIDQYLDWSEAWIREVHRLTREQGAFWLNLGYVSLENKAKAIPLPYLLWDRIPFFLVQEIVWNYAAGVAGKSFLSPRNEKFLWYVKNSDNYTFNLDDIRDPNVKYPNQKKNGKLKCNPIGKNPTDVWQIAKVTSGANRSSKERTKHPAQFPIELISRVIKASSNKGNLVFDPFMGSGSTAVAAINNNRKVFGIEIREDYLKIAIDRIEEAERMKFFDQNEKNTASEKLIFIQGNQFQLC